MMPPAPERWAFSSPTRTLGKGAIVVNPLGEVTASSILLKLSNGTLDLRVRRPFPFLNALRRW